MAERSRGPVVGWRGLGKSWYRRCVEAGDRLAMRMGRAMAGATGRPRIAAAVSGRFPLYFHTFAYQELVALHRQMGAEVRVFYVLDGDWSAVDPAFAYLLRHPVRLPNAREISQRDYRHYCRIAPDRVESLLEALAVQTGRSVGELAQDVELLRAFSFARKVELYRPDYIHTFFFYGESLGGLVAQWLLGIPRGVTAYTDHALDDWSLKVVPLHLATADLVVATSRRTRDELIELGGGAHAAGVAAKIVVKPNGVDGRRFPFAERRPRAGPGLELLSVSRLEPKKGLLELVDVAVACRQRGLQVRFHIVGGIDPERRESMDYAEALRDKIDRCGMGAAFTLHGRRSQEELRPLFRGVDAFVAPYVETASGDKDGIPTAVLEAMSSGLAIVATDAGSLTEVLDDGVEGRIVPQRDPARMAEVLAELAADSGWVARMGRCAHERFAREFDVKVTEVAFHERLAVVLRATLAHGLG